MLINYTGDSKVIKRICELINTMTGVNFEVVQTLPLVDISTSTIYLLPKQDPASENIYDEYINTDGTSQGWELIGTTEIDLTNYYTKTEADAIFSTTDENVKQVYTQSTAGEFLLIASNSNSSSTSDETDKVKKIAHVLINATSGNLTICRKHTSANLSNNILTVGNDTPEGTSGNVDGILRLYGKGEYYVQLYDGYNALTNNRTYRLRNETGVLALLSDVTNKAVLAELKDLNLMNPPYYHSRGTYTNLDYATDEDDGNYTVKGSDTSNRALNLKRYTQGFYLPPGKYRMSGCPAGGSSSTYSIRVYSATEGGTTTGIGNDYGNGLEFSLTTRTLMQIVFYVNANQSVNFTFRPKLERISEWVKLGTYTKNTTYTISDEFDEFLIESNEFTTGSVNMVVSRAQLSTTQKRFHINDGSEYLDVLMKINGANIEIIGDTTAAVNNFDVYAKA